MVAYCVLTAADLILLFWELCSQLTV